MNKNNKAQINFNNKNQKNNFHPNMTSVNFYNIFIFQLMVTKNIKNFKI